MAPFLLTSDDDGRPHAIAVALRLDGDRLVGPCGRTSSRNATARPAVSVLWPPDAPEGYSLIVDGDAAIHASDAGGATVAIAPTHAILHRPAAVPDPTTECAHDCVPVARPD